MKIIKCMFRFSWCFVNRDHYLKQIEYLFSINRIVTLLGPRQCGKTTIAKKFCGQIADFPKINYFDLENPEDLSRLANPKITLENLNGTIVIDEIQRRPDLFPILRYLHDEYPDKNYLILGSASRELIRQTSESLAGRISYLEITPFSLGEIAPEEIKTLWQRGGYPKSFLAATDKASATWLRDYVRTYVEQDLYYLGLTVNIEQMKRFWAMVSHYHGQIFNAAELATSLGIATQTVRNYLEILNATFMIRILKPWYENLKKRQVKSPKIYLRDSGIFHHFMNIKSYSDLLIHPKLGASWEGFALEQTIRSLELEAAECYFWSTHNQAELDLLSVQGSTKIGYEFKYVDAPRITPSMLIALSDLRLEKLTIIYPGEKPYQLSDRIFVQPLVHTGDDSG